jgi:hypothetical protein
VPGGGGGGGGREGGREGGRDAPVFEEGLLYFFRGCLAKPAEGNDICKEVVFLYCEK